MVTIAAMEAIGPVGVGALPSQRPLAGRDVLLLGAAALLCVAHFPFFVLPSSTPRLAILVLLAIPGVFSLVHLARNRDGVATSAATLAAWVVAAAFLSGAPLIALTGMYGRELSGVIVIAVLCVWATGRTASTRTVDLLPTVLVFALGINALVGVLQFIAAPDSGSLVLQAGRASGLTPSPVYFGALMAGGAVLCASVRSFPIPARLLGVTGFALACNLSGSRVASAAGLFGVLLYVAAGPQVDTLPKRLLPSVAFLFGIGIGSVLASWLGDGSGTSTSRLTSGGEAGRLDAWRYAAQALAERPIGGWGFGRFRAATQEHFTAAFVRDYAASDVTQIWFDSHNLIVTTAVAIGLIGLGLAFWFGIGASRIAHGPLSHFAFVLAITWLLEPAGLTTLPIGMLALGAAASRISDNVTRPKSLPRRQWTGALAAGTAIPLAAWVAVADVGLKHAIESGRPQDVESAARWFPRDAVVADVVAQAWFRAEEGDRTLRRDVLDWSREATRAEPDRPYLWSRLGLRQAAFGDFDDAQASIERALELQPWHLQSWQLLYAIGGRLDDDQLIRRSSEALCQMGQQVPECSTADS